MPALGSHNWYLLAIFTSGAIIQSQCRGRMIDTCLKFTDLGQLSNPIAGVEWLIFVCNLQVWSLVWSFYPIPVLGVDDWDFLVICISAVIIQSQRWGRSIDICLWFTGVELSSNPSARVEWLICVCNFQIWGNYPIPALGVGWLICVCNLQVWSYHPIPVLGLNDW